MQNMFSWLTLIPELDKIAGMLNFDNQSLITDNFLVLIDEIDLYSHPEWQRKIVKQLIDTINSTHKNKRIQIIIT